MLTPSAICNLPARFWTIEREQWLPAERIAELQRYRLQRLITNAYRRVPYYRRLLDNLRARPGDIGTPVDLRSLPVLKKSVVQDDPQEFMAEGADLHRCVVRETSGSTGRPLRVRRTEAEEILSGLLHVRAQLANGHRPWYRQAIVYGDRHPPRIENWLDRMRYGRRLYLWSGLDPEQQVRAIRQHRPLTIRGYSQSLKLLALAARKARISDIKPRVVFGLAESLDAGTRALIDDVFGVRMVDLYSTEEAGPIAWECPAHSGYHINSDQLIVEFLHNGRPAQPGEAAHVVVTPLYLHTMPLIRYDLEDVVTFTERRCVCGRELPLIQTLEGRTDSFIVLRSGRVIPPVGTFAVVLEREPSVAEYLLVQESYDLVVVKVVEGSPGGAQMVERVRRGIGELLRHEATVRVDIVDRIDRRGAKLRRIISHVNPSS